MKTIKTLANPALLISTLAISSIASANPVWYLDQDNDGWGDQSNTVTGLSMPVDYAPLKFDCHDQDASTHFGQPDVWDGADNDCDGWFDEGVGHAPTLNGLPVGSFIDDYYAVVGEELTFDIAIDDDGDVGNISVMVSVFPGNAVFSLTATSQNVIGTFSWVPTLADVGLHKFEIYPRDIEDFGGGWGLINVAAVPVPAAVWLFGSGLLGLVGVARRKEKISIVATASK